MNTFKIDDTYLGTIPSTNYGVREPGSIIDSIVIHDTVTSTFKEALDIFQKPGSQVSVHYLIDLSASGQEGTYIYQLLKDKARAFHAGVSYWAGKKNLNETSIGIELVNVGDQPFPSAQMDSLIELIKFIMNNNPAITLHNVISHADVGPGRKYDPNCTFDWKEVNNSLGIYPKLFDTHGTDKVIIGDTVKVSADTIRSIQISMVKIGYYNLKINHLYDSDTQNIFHAFNQHFAPETFAREIMNDQQQMVIKEENNQWYNNSQVRLNNLLQIINSINTLAIDGQYIYAGSSDGSTWVRSLDTEWKSMGSPTICAINTLVTDSQYLYAGASDGSAWIRGLGVAEDWKPIDSPTKCAINTLATDKEYLYAGSYDGSTWIRKLGIGTDWVSMGAPTNCAINTLITDDHYLYAGASDGSTWVRGLDVAKDWVSLGSPTNCAINTLATDKQYLYAGASDGSTWIRGVDTEWESMMADSPISSFINTLMIDDSRYIYAGASDGSMWVRPLGWGTHYWVSVDSPTSSFINVLITDDQYIYVSTTNGSIWVRPLGGIATKWINISVPR